MSTLVGWVGGDAFKCVYIFTLLRLCLLRVRLRTVYFFLQGSPLQFKVCAIFQLSIDCGTRLTRGSIMIRSHVLPAIVVQRVLYGNPPPATALIEEDDLEQALALAEE